MSIDVEYLKEQYEELKIATDLCIDQITIAYGNGIFRKINKSCEQYFGVSEDEIIGKSGFEMEKMGVFNISATAEVVRRQQKVRFVQVTKAQRVLLVTGYPIFDKNNKLSKIINTSTDITNQRDLEKEFKDTEAKLEWFRNERSHRINAEEYALSAESKNMNAIKELINNFADKDILILLLGETGVGKSYIANYMHNISNRRKEPFITINCGAIPYNLLESELFGYEKGSFTGALNSGKHGLFEVAANGTIFLDEIAELPLELQVKLLTVLDERKFRRVGGNEDFDIKARILVATNKDLVSCVNDGTFREDLYYRINTFPITVPNLSERIEDIPVLIDKFLKSYNEKYEMDKRIDPGAYEQLLLYGYPGNIRELKNIIERLVIISEKRIINEKDVKKVINFGDLIKSKNRNIENNEEIKIVPLKKGVEAYEKRLLIAVSKKYKTTREQAKALGVDQSTIVRKRMKYSL